MHTVRDELIHQFTTDFEILEEENILLKGILRKHHNILIPETRSDKSYERYFQKIRRDKFAVNDDTDFAYDWEVRKGGFGVNKYTQTGSDLPDAMDISIEKVEEPQEVIIKPVMRRPRKSTAMQGSSISTKDVIQPIMVAQNAEVVVEITPPTQKIADIRFEITEPTETRELPKSSRNDIVEIVTPPQIQRPETVTVLAGPDYPVPSFESVFIQTDALETPLEEPPQGLLSKKKSTEYSRSNELKRSAESNASFPNILDSERPLASVSNVIESIITFEESFATPIKESVPKPIRSPKTDSPLKECESFKGPSEASKGQISEKTTSDATTTHKTLSNDTYKDHLLPEKTQSSAPNSFESVEKVQRSLSKRLFG